MSSCQGEGNTAHSHGVYSAYVPQPISAGVQVRIFFLWNCLGVKLDFSFVFKNLLLKILSLCNSRCTTNCKYNLWLRLLPIYVCACVCISMCIEGPRQMLSINTCNITSFAVAVSVTYTHALMHMQRPTPLSKIIGCMFAKPHLWVLHCFPGCSDCHREERAKCIHPSFMGKKLSLGNRRGKLT